MFLTHLEKTKRVIIGDALLTDYYLDVVRYCRRDFGDGVRDASVHLSQWICKS